MKQNIYIFRSVVVSSLMVAGLISFANDLNAQDVYLNEKDRTMILEKNLWHNLNNAAGLAVTPILNNGKVEAKAMRAYGDYRRAQEGRAENSVNIYADQYRNLNDKVYIWGKFNGTIEKEYGRAWSDAYFIDNQNPYMYGSAVKGDYVRQIYDFSAKMASKRYGKFNYGLKLDFKAIDQSRINDPRPRTLIADYGVAPSIVFHINSKHSLGFDVSYRFLKEKLTNINTVQASKDFVYFDFLGMENYKEVALTSFWRNTRSYYWGGDFQYFYNGDDLDIMLDLNYKIRTDKIEGAQQSSPGDFKSTTYGLNFGITKTSESFFHSGNFKATYIKGFSNFFRQESRQETDELGNTSQWWETVYEALSYRNEQFIASAEYKLFFVKGSTSYKRFASIGVDFKSLQEKYILPYSERNIDIYRIKAGYSDDLVNFKNSSYISYNINFGYIAPTKTNQTLSVENKLATNVYNKDLLYFRKSSVSSDIEIAYNMGIKTASGAIGAYVKAFGSGLFAFNQKENPYKNQRLWTGGVAIGVILK